MNYYVHEKMTSIENNWFITKMLVTIVITFLLQNEAHLVQGDIVVD